MKNDWETRWLPPVTLGIIRMTSLWLDHKKKEKPFLISSQELRLKWDCLQQGVRKGAEENIKESKINVMQRCSGHKYLIRGSAPPLAPCLTPCWDMLGSARVTEHLAGNNFNPIPVYICLLGLKKKNKITCNHLRAHWPLTPYILMYFHSPTHPPVNRGGNRLGRAHTCVE